MKKLQATLFSLNIDGTLESSRVLDVEEKDLGRKKSDLEVKAQEYKYSDMSLVLKQLPYGYFDDYDLEVRVFLISIQEIGGDVLFFGYVDPESISKALPSKAFQIRVLSIEKLLEASPDVNPRGAYDTRLVLVGAETGGAAFTLGQLPAYYGPVDPDGNFAARTYRDAAMFRFFMETDAQYDKYREPGCVIHAKASHSNDGGSMDIKVHMYQVSTISTNGGVGLYEAHTNLLSADTMFNLSGDGEIIQDVVYYNDDTCGLFVAMPELGMNNEAFDTGEGARKAHLLVYDEVNSREFRFSVISVEYGTYDFGGVIGEREAARIHFNDHLELVENNLVNGWFADDWTYWLMPAIPAVFSTQTINAFIYTKQMYGQNQSVASGSNFGYGDYYIGENILQGMLDTVPFMKELEPLVETYQTSVGNPPEIRLAPIFTLSSRPEKALTEMQKGMDCLIKVEYSGTGTLGMPVPVFKMYSRSYLADQVDDVIDLDIPTTWEEPPTGKLPIVLVKGPGNINAWVNSSENYGWYAEEKDGTPNFSVGAYELPKGGNLIEVEIDKVVVTDQSYFKDEVSEFFYNNAQLRAIAENIYLTSGQYYRKVTATFSGERMVGLDLVAKIVREPYQDVTGICIGQDVDYRRNSVTLTILLDTQ